MRPRIALATLVLAVLTALTLVRPAAAGPWGLAPGEWYTNLEAGTFTANTFRPADGGRADSGLIVEERAIRTLVEVGWKKRASLVFGLPVLSVTRRDARVQGTATGFQDVLVGVRYNLKNGSSAAAVELDWSGPSGYNRHLDTLGIRLGDGLQELSAQLQLGRAIGGRGFFQGSIGYGHRYLGIGKREKGAFVPGDPRTAKYLWADRLNASADLGIWIGKSVLAGGRYRGLMTISNGALMPETDVHLAGALLLYRVDDRLDMFGGFMSTAKGKNTLHYDQVYLGLAFHRTKLNKLQGFLGGTQTP
jgi:hypothetical protein